MLGRRVCRNGLVRDLACTWRMSPGVGLLTRAKAEEGLIYCVAQDKESANHDMNTHNSRLFYSTDFFKSDRKHTQFKLPNIRDARSIVTYAIVMISKFVVDAMMKDKGDMVFYVTINAYAWWFFQRESRSISVL
ncbi:hypothetical protein DL96DRAFT_1821753 [Flagelloscypha sp. PMI_526]|nr:hypothetical protein DL96DRAFT_1821753 [Flagelloscypha sp. PMI_526]